MKFTLKIEIKDPLRDVNTKSVFPGYEKNMVTGNTHSGGCDSTYRQSDLFKLIQMR